MKKTTALIFAFIAVLSAAGCGSSGSASNKDANSSAKTVNDVLSQAQQATAQSEAPSKSAAAQPQTTTAPSAEKHDFPELDYEAEVDLTSMSGTMIFATVNDMMTNPDKYIGKTVKMSGVFDVYMDDPTSKNYYFSCLIKDATACCARGIEFVAADERTYPGDYPKTNAPITVGGVFETYFEGEKMYARLKDAVLAY